MNRRAFITGLGAVLAAPRAGAALSRNRRMYRARCLTQGGPVSTKLLFSRLSRLALYVLAAS